MAEQAARRFALGLVLALGVLLALTASARAMPGPSTLTLGLSDDPVFRDSPASVRSVWLDRASSVGSQAIRLDIFWNLIAPGARPSHWNPSNPADPHYDWALVDASIKAIAAHGEKVLLMVRGAPRWAEQGLPAGIPDPSDWDPSPAAFGQFAHALAVRYSGHFKVQGHALPRVSWFQPWNEPNLSYYLLPQWYRTSSGAYVPASPGIYRALLNSFYVAVKSVQPGATVVAAGTAPYGDPPGGIRMYPVTFLQQLFCLSPQLKPQSCPNPPHLDDLDHHPYGATPRVHAQLSGDIAVPDIYKINRILGAAERYHHVLPAGPKRVWITEIDWTSQPNYSPTKQAYYVSLGFYTLWSQGVGDIFWFFIRDSIQPQQSFSDSGLFTTSGAAKPSAQAYRFPFVAIRTGKHKLILWGRAPRAGTVTIQKQVHGGWQTLLHVRTDSSGLLYAVTKRYGEHAVIRATLGHTASMGWPTDGHGT